MPAIVPRVVFWNSSPATVRSKNTRLAYYRAACHFFGWLEAGGMLENAQAMAARESPRTTKLYARTGDEITLDEVERITI
jgi:hypothetical protein